MSRLHWLRLFAAYARLAFEAVALDLHLFARAVALATSDATARRFAARMASPATSSRMLV